MPNAGIIKLQGSKDLTVQTVESRADEIFTSEGLKIINTAPESGRVSIAVERPNRQVLHTEPVLLAYLRSYSPAECLAKSFSLVSVKKMASLCYWIRSISLILLIAGITGSGKSVLHAEPRPEYCSYAIAGRSPYLSDRPEVRRGLPSTRRTTPCRSWLRPYR